MHAPFTFWAYQRPKPGTDPRRRWRQDCLMVTEWAYAPLSACGTYYDLTKQVTGFADERAARAAANEVKR